MKQQVLVIHGGNAFEKYDDFLEYLQSVDIDIEGMGKKGWKSVLAEELGDTFEVLSPRMPNKENAKYAEWNIWFERFIPFLHDGVILVGHSLGGSFLAKYLAEEQLPRKARATLLVAAPCRKEVEGFPKDFFVPENLSRFAKQGGDILLFHSKDDEVVPFESLGAYQKALPRARSFVYEDRGHFNQEEFPEIVQEIKRIAAG